MAFDCVQQKKPLFSDLFKTTKPQAETPSWSSSSASGSSWSHSLLSCDSSSSGFSTPLYSDLGSSESDDGDFIAELTRQMAECMLQDEDDEESTDRNCVRDDCQANSQVKNSSKINTDTTGSSSGVDDRMAPLQVYELKNQPPVSKRGRKKRAKAAESAQFPKKAPPPKKTEQRHLTPPQYAGRDWGIAPGINGMQAVFLGRPGSGSRTGLSGTGFFLPRVAGDPAELRKKSGCPMVLIPTRVLQVLESHFTKVQDSTWEHASSNGLCPRDESCGAGQQLQDGQPHEVGNAIKISGNNNYEASADIMQLPKEWTY